MAAALVCARVPLAADMGDDVATALAARTPKPTLDLVERLRADPTADARKALVKLAFETPSVRLRRATAAALSSRADRDDAIDSVLFRWQAAATNPDVSARAIEILAAMPSAKTEKALAIRRKQSDPGLADAVASAWFEVVTSGGSFEEVRRTLRSDESPRRRAEAAAALVHFAPAPPAPPCPSAERALETLASALGAERSPAVRDAILRALAAFPRDAADAALFDRLARADSDTRATLLLASALRPSPGTEEAARRALKAGPPAQIAAGLVALGASVAPNPADDADVRARLGHADAGVRDAALEALLRRAPEPAARRALLARPDLPTAARVALLASLAVPASAESLAALVAALDDPSPAVVATAIGALRRGQGAPGREALAAARTRGPSKAKAILDSMGAAVSESTKPRAFVVRGSLDRAEDVFTELGYGVVTFTSGSSLATIRATPEDVVYVDGPGEIDARGQAALWTYLHLGGTVVLGGGLQNLVLRALLPDTFDPTPKSLKLETSFVLPVGVIDRVVTPALGAPDALAAALGPTPSVVGVSGPLVPRTVAARPLLWSLDMEETYGGAPCVCAEVRVGCGRILATGAILGLKGAEATDGWFARVRMDRRTPPRYPSDATERFWVAYDWLGFAPDRLDLLLKTRYFDGADAVAATPDMPAGRFLLAYLKLR